MAAPGFDLIVSSLATDFVPVKIGILAVFATLTGVYVAWKGAWMIINAVRGDDVYYHGHFWNKDTYDSAMDKLERFKSRGGELDDESEERLHSWKQSKLKDQFFGEGLSIGGEGIEPGHRDDPWSL